MSHEHNGDAHHQDGGPPPAGALVVAIDGPSGSGKSTVARRVAVALGLRYLDTGAMYRAVTWRVLHLGVPVLDEDAVHATAAAAELVVGTSPAEQRVLVDGRDVTAAIRGDEVTRAVSAVSAVPGVRALLVARQRDLARGGGIVVEGRDIGTVVLPGAPVKIFLTAEHSARALRRALQFTPAAAADVDGTSAELRRRDEFDSGRAVSPLRRAEDATVIDTTGLGLDEVVGRVLALCGEATGATRAQRRGPA